MKMVLTVLNFCLLFIFVRNIKKIRHVFALVYAMCIIRTLGPYLCCSWKQSFENIFLMLKLALTMLLRFRLNYIRDYTSLYRIHWKCLLEPCRFFFQESFGVPFAFLVWVFQLWDMCCWIASFLSQKTKGNRFLSIVQINWSTSDHYWPVCIDAHFVPRGRESKYWHH